MKNPTEKHIKSAIIGMHRSGASPEEIAIQLQLDLIWFLPYIGVFDLPTDYVRKVLKEYKPLRIKEVRA